MENQNTPQEQQPSATGGNYASFGKRLVAALIDGIIFVVVGGLLSSILGINPPTSGDYSYNASFGTSNMIPTLLFWIYAVFMDVRYGATLGKMAMKIRVQHQESGANLTYIQAVLRETVGKMLSTFVLLLGYFWMLWDKNKQTWHDKLGSSVVVDK
jgi:uncharacterized RDD family membrane protein YckC